MVAHASNHSYWQTQVGGLWPKVGHREKHETLSDK
jgi:hypothetical protein